MKYETFQDENENMNMREIRVCVNQHNALGECWPAVGKNIRAVFAQVENSHSTMWRCRSC